MPSLIFDAQVAFQVTSQKLDEISDKYGIIERRKTHTATHGDAINLDEPFQLKN